jgi:PAS domain S-box-containing protein
MDTILEHIPHMVFVKDAKELSVIRINQAGIDILGYERHQLLGKRQMDLFPAEQAAFFREKDMEVFNTGKMVDIPEEPVQTSSGLRWMQTKKIPIFENGGPRYLIGISEDITERKQSQDAIKALNKELESFTYSVSHDLRAPLRAISGYAEILAMDYKNVLDDEGRRLLGRVSHNAIKMGNLIDDLLSFSRLGRKKLNKTNTNMNNIVKEALNTLQKNTPAKTTIKVNELHHAFTDSSLILQVMINLIDNAIKYSSKKELPVVELTSSSQDGAVIIEVKDNGAGFDMRYSDKLFNVFQRLHSSDEFEGTGVGLAIVQLIVNKHGGKAWANSQLNTATSFYVYLPIH